MGPSAWTAAILASGCIGVEVVARLDWISDFTLIAVSDMASRTASLLSDPAFLASTLFPSLTLILASFSVSVCLGVTAAYILWRLPTYRKAFEPYLNIYYAIPTFALYPLIVVVMGVGAAPILLLSVLFSMVVVITNTLNGFEAVPLVVRKLGASLRLTPGQHFQKVLLPAAIPSIAIGVRFALVYSVVSVLATEFILSTHGLGHFIAFSYNNFQVDNMYAGILMVCVIALLGNILVAKIQQRLDWRGE